MAWLAGAGLGLVLAVSGALVVAGLSGLVRRRRRAALKLAAGLLLFAGYVVMLGGIAFLLGPSQMIGTEIGPSQKARALGEAISDLMDISCAGLPLGLIFGIGRLLGTRRSPEKSGAR